MTGAWPLGAETEATAPTELVERLQAYMIKAAREAKLHTSWLTPNQAYEEALTRFIERVLTRAGGARFIPMMRPFQRRIAAAGMVNSLSQVVMKIGSPGVPDFYQGTDLWDLNLVDPDNPATSESPPSMVRPTLDLRSPDHGDARWAMIRYASPRDWREGWARAAVAVCKENDDSG